MDTRIFITIEEGYISPNEFIDRFMGGTRVNNLTLEKQLNALECLCDMFEHLNIWGGEIGNIEVGTNQGASCKIETPWLEVCGEETPYTCFFSIKYTPRVRFSSLIKSREKWTFRKYALQIWYTILQYRLYPVHRKERKRVRQWLPFCHSVSYSCIQWRTLSS